MSSALPRKDDAQVLVSVDAIDVFYGRVQALRSLSLHVNSGEMIALVGANGAGKTTTLRSISGLLKPSSGSIVFEGRSIAGLPAHEVINLGIAHVPEGRDLFPSLTVVENMRMGFWVRRGEGSARYHERLEELFDAFPRLRERSGQLAGTLSGGEQQMLVMARALMSNPKLLVVDELSLGLAPMIVEQLFEVLKTVNRAGTSVLLVEQFVSMALSNTDRAYALAHGAVVLEGRSSDLLSDPELIAAYLGGETPKNP